MSPNPTPDFMADLAVLAPASHERLSDFLALSIRGTIEDAFRLKLAPDALQWSVPQTALTEEQGITAIVPIEHGPFRARIELQFETACLSSMLTRIYGQEHELSWKDLRDGACELLNVAYCRFKDLADPDSRVFKMVLPRTLKDEQMGIVKTEACSILQDDSPQDSKIELLAAVDVPLNTSLGRMTARYHVWKNGVTP